jgi:hypothetical protein
VFIDRENSIEILASMDRVLLRLLRLIIAGFLDDGAKWETESVSKPRREAGDEVRAVSGRYARDPLGSRLRLPAIPDHIHYSGNEIVAEPIGVLAVGHDATPAGVPPSGQHAAFLRQQVRRKRGSKAVCIERSARNPFLRRKGHLGRAQKAGRRNPQSTVERRRDDLLPDTPSALAAGLSSRIVKSVPQEPHQAVFRRDVCLYLSPFDFALSSQSLDLRVVQSILNGRTLPAATASRSARVLMK